MFDEPVRSKQDRYQFAAINAAQSGGILHQEMDFVQKPVFTRQFAANPSKICGLAVGTGSQPVQPVTTGV
jgi:hypothetical protein